MGSNSEFKQLLKYIRENPREDTPIITRQGKIFELRLFGFTTDGAVIFEDDEYIPFPEALEEMKNTQPVGYDPHRPTEGCNKEFFEAVQSFLFINQKDLKLYIAVGTRLDYWHGTDAVFTLGDVHVTLDATLDVTKNYKADFLITSEDVDSGNLYGSLARRIALTLTGKYLNKIELERIQSLTSRT